MVSFFFWNLNKQDLRAIVARAAVEREVDVLLLAECVVPDNEMVRELNEVTGRVYYSISELGDKVKIFSVIEPGRWMRQYSDENRHMVMWNVKLIGSRRILIGAVHFIGKLHTGTTDQLVEALELSHELSMIEAAIQHQQSLLIGDFNMNPFEKGMTAAKGFHSVMTRELTNRKSKKQRDLTPKYLYNPMWAFFGERTDGPPGTYYFGKARGINIYWHMFDQLLLRPGLMNLLDDLEIIVNIDGTSLLNQGGKPNVKIYSDHLPIAFRLNLE